MDSSMYTIMPAPFNSDQLDFSPSYNKNEIVFVSNRRKSTFYKNIFAWDESNYLDLYTTQPGGKVIKIPGNINTKYHEGPITFNINQDMAIFTRTNYFHSRFRKSKDGTKKLKLFSAKFKNESWGDIAPLPFNNDQYSVGHPAFNKQNDKLYFVSDMPGGFGGTDIYVVDYQNGKWGIPVNMGRPINSEGNEMFTYMDASDNLYFASDGLAGLGGLDVFCAKNNNGKFAEPINLGYPINSNFDDFGLIINSNGDEGYFTSNRGVNSDDNIYRFAKHSKEMIIHVLDKLTKKPIPLAQLSIVKAKIGEVKTQTDSSGVAVITVIPNIDFTILTNKETYYPDSIVYTAAELAKLNELTVLLEMPEIKPPPVVVEAPKPVIPKPKPIAPKADYVFNLIGLVVDAFTDSVLSNLSVVITDLNTGEKQSLTADNFGTFNVKLAKNTDYSVRLDSSSSGYSFNPITENVSTKGYKTSKTIYAEFPVVMLNPYVIYFDLDKYNTRVDAAKELNKVVAIMKRTPDLYVEMETHTDCRGSNEYNMRLSEKRAVSSKAYIVQNGIAEKRISSLWFGETRLVNRCADGVKCPEEEHQLNRRTEVKFINMEKAFKNSTIMMKK